MWDAAAEVTAALERALTSFAEVVAGAAPGWLVLGVVLHLVNQVARGCGWCTLLRGATGEQVRRSDAVLAWVAGRAGGGAGGGGAPGGGRVAAVRARLGGGRRGDAGRRLPAGDRGLGAGR